MPPKRRFVRRCGRAACVCMMTAFASQACLPFIPGLDLLASAAPAAVSWGIEAYHNHNHGAGKEAASKTRKPDAFNSGLIANLRIWDAGGWHFDHIYLYKTSLTSASGGKESDVPNIGDRTHHQGVILRVAKDGQQQNFLKLDFGPDGLRDDVSEDFPHIPKQIPWNESQRIRFQNASIDVPKHGSPRRLIRVLEFIKDIPYDALKWNCQCFAEVMWQYFPTWNTGWVPDIYEILQNVARKLNLIDEGNHALSKVFNQSVQKVG